MQPLLGETYPITRLQIATLIGRAMAEQMDYRIWYLSLALTPAAMFGGPLVLGFEE